MRNDTQDHRIIDFQCHTEFRQRHNPSHRHKSSDLQRHLFVFTNTRHFISFTELSKSEFHKHPNHTQSPSNFFVQPTPLSSLHSKLYSTRIEASMFRFCKKSAIDTLQRNKRVIHICSICCLSNIRIATLDFGLSQLAKVDDRQLANKILNSNGYFLIDHAAR